ncbi:hypothetical protein A3762_08250 [Oleiphilus sp. HI0125]|nr:hypothetical protein A3762_08250 [Oleiphilus sp. HI0125]
MTTSSDCNSYSPLTVSKASEAQFDDLRKNWNDLLQRSLSDTLFLTWEWQNTWWKTWARKLNLTLNLLLVRDKHDQLVGIAPLYSHKTRIAKIFPCTQLAFIGSSARIGNTVRSEYLDFICNKAQHTEIQQALLNYLEQDKSWDKLVLSDMDTKSGLFAAATSPELFDHQCYARSVLKDYGIRIQKTEAINSLDQYVPSLSASMRRESFHRRTRLARSGEMNINRSISDTNTAFKTLNAFHEARWGKPCFDDDALAFHQTLIYSPSKPFIADFESISIGEKPQTVIYNIDYQSTRYNLQLGFGETSDKKLSLGFLQIGYSIESFFEQNKLSTYDLLAGSGKNSFYKEKFNGQAYRLFSVEVIRSKIIKLLYKLYDQYKKQERPF